MWERGRTVLPERFELFGWFYNINKINEMN